MTIETPESFQAHTRDMAEIPLKVSHELDGEAVTMFTQVQKTPVPLWFYMDSGNLRGVLVAPHAAEVLGLKGETTYNLQIAGQPYETKGEVMNMIYDGALDVRFFMTYVIALDLQTSRAWVKRSFTE